MRPIQIPVLMLSASAILTLSVNRTAHASENLTLTPDSVSTQPADPALQGSPRIADQDYATRLTLYWENDGGFAKPNGRTDRHYTAGAGASLAFQAPIISALISKVPTFNNEFDPQKSDYAAGLVGSLNIFTPQDLSNPNPIHNDRPYAGWTYAGLFLQRANRAAQVPVYESLEFDLGILGPSSLAENAQFMVHNYYHYITPQGWNNQIHDEPEFNIQYNRRWKFAFLQQLHDQYAFAPQFEVMPELGFTAGTLLDEAHAGALARMGWNLPNDFGPGNLHRPADFTWTAPCSCGTLTLDSFLRSQSFYIFARPYGQLTAHDATLQGDNFRNDDPVTVNPTFGNFGFEYGLSYRFLKHFELTYTETFESPTFDGQRAWDSFASLQMSFFIAW